MPSGLSSYQLHQLARRGVLIRIEEIRKEMAAIEVLAGERAQSGRSRRKGARHAGRKRGQLSASGRAAIAAAQRARWARIKAAKGQGVANQGRKGRRLAASGPGEMSGKSRGRPRRRMSAAQRKAVGERMKKYWASRRAAKK